MNQGLQGGVASENIADNHDQDDDDDDVEAAEGIESDDDDDEDTDEARIEADEYHSAVEAVPVILPPNV